MCPGLETLGAHGRAGGQGAEDGGVTAPALACCTVVPLLLSCLLPGRPNEFFPWGSGKLCFWLASYGGLCMHLGYLGVEDLGLLPDAVNCI